MKALVLESKQDTTKNNPLQVLAYNKAGHI